MYFLEILQLLYPWRFITTKLVVNHVEKTTFRIRLPIREFYFCTNNKQCRLVKPLEDVIFTFIIIHSYIIINVPTNNVVTNISFFWSLFDLNGNTLTNLYKYQRSNIPFTIKFSLNLDVYHFVFSFNGSSLITYYDQIFVLFCFSFSFFSVINRLNSGKFLNQQSPLTLKLPSF